MRHIVLITTMAFVAGLFIVSQGLGAGEYGQDKVSEDVGMDQGTTGMDQQGTTGMDQGMTGIDQSVAAVQLDSNQITEMQRLLGEKGYDPGHVDGVIDQQTRDALRNFQEAQELAATGEPTEETLRALAPDVETQEMLGLSPEFGQDQMQQDQMQQPMDPMEDQPIDQPMEQQMESPWESGTDETEQPSGTY